MKETKVNAKRREKSSQGEVKEVNSTMALQSSAVNICLHCKHTVSRMSLHEAAALKLLLVLLMWSIFYL